MIRKYLAIVISLHLLGTLFIVQANDQNASNSEKMPLKFMVGLSKNVGSAVHIGANTAMICIGGAVTLLSVAGFVICAPINTLTHDSALMLFLEVLGRGTGAIVSGAGVIKGVKIISVGKSLEGATESKSN